MPGGEIDDDPLSRWLSGDGLTALDAITGEALDIVGVMDRQLTMRYVNWTAPGLTRESVVGRNLWGHGDTAMAARAFRFVIHDGMAPEAALAAAGT